ncbi:MAG TPA: rRNA maturation RNase YbeY [Rhizomicrobium sp.]|jgi:probable rRNA maturation factor
MSGITPVAEGISLVVEDDGWRSHRGLQSRLKLAAQAARKAGKLEGDFTILLSSDRKLRTLNRDFRGKDKPTNVLSFPADTDYAGDIAMAYGVTRKEAKAAGKTFSDHAVHLAVHGVLHLAGYDHERLKDAKVMEPLEVKILARLGIADPYGVPAQ